LLLFGLFAAGIDGFRVRDRERTSPASPTQTTEEGGVHTADMTAGIPPR
jgi:hypothetical protein